MKIRPDPGIDYILITSRLGYVMSIRPSQQTVIKVVATEGITRTDYVTVIINFAHLNLDR